MIIGHQKQWRFLEKCAKEGRFSHAYLFSGVSQIGKKKIALEWVSLLLGQDIKKGQLHPDAIFIEPEEKEIQIGQIKNLIWNLSLKPYSAPLKTAIIDRAHSMNREAQTSLLKTLEEPRGKSVIILLSEEPEYLLPTIVSRVETIKFYPVNDKEIKPYLKERGLSEKDILEILGMACGKPGLAIDLASDPQKIQSFNQKILDLNKILEGSLASRFQYAQFLDDNPSEIKETLSIWLSFFRGILLSKIEKREEYLKYPAEKLKKILKSIENTILLTSTTNINSRLALENLMLEF
ncbi:MAG: hypothetical protein PHW72_02660 [Candidatus Pacebacteria bacterium]|nr:hypothetical protein [Candidatus Paceibacterota bacterium]